MDFLKKFWHFLWYEDSFSSWIANVILAFILVKFIIYPSLGFLLGTQFPIVAVVSSSMEHEENFDDWWNNQQSFYEKYNISKEEFENYPFNEGFNKGDLMILYGKNSKEIKKGDILVFRSRSKPIIHRVINKWEENDNHFFTTKGDNNRDIITSRFINEDKIRENRVLGVGVFRIPFLGWVKIGFVNLINLFV